MDISLFIEFSMIVKHGNLSEAARELHTTQPALSRHLSILEKEIGAKLLDRSKNPMELTYVGEQFLQKSANIANEYHRLLYFIDSIKGKQLDRVSVSGLFDSSAFPYLKHAKKLVEREQPGLEIKFVSPPFQTPFDLLRQRDLDVAIEPLSSMIDIHELDSVKITSEKPYIVMDVSHPHASRPSIGIESFDELCFTSLRSNKDHATRKHLQEICKRNGLEGAIPKSLSLSPAETYNDLFLYGFGNNVLMLPESLAKKYTSVFGSEYVAVPFVCPDCEYDIRAFYSKHCSSNTRVFIDTVQGFVEGRDT